MKRMNSRWWLPILQILLTLGCYSCDYLARTRATGNDPAFYAQNHPSWVQRVSYGINFPALALDYPLKNAGDPELYKLSTKYVYVVIYPRDVGFFIGILLFWHCVGRTVDGRWGWPRAGARFKWVRFLVLFLGAGFAVLNAAYADELLASHFLPERQVAIFGLVWACALTSYFMWKLVGQITACEQRSSWPSIFAGLMVVAVLWVGGSLGLTEGLGEFLRPTTVKMMHMQLAVGDCSTTATVPAPLMQIVETQRALHQLKLQQVAVCSTGLVIDRDGEDLTKWIGARGYSDQQWQTLPTGCCTYQYRRHFAVVVGGFAKGVPIVIQAVLIQSRWNYLVQNWDKAWECWFWPYPDPS